MIIARLKRYKLYQKPSQWTTQMIPAGSFPFFWMAKWRAYFIMHHNPFAKVWIIPRGKKPKSFDRNIAKFSRVVARWKFDPYAGIDDQ